MPDADTTESDNASVVTRRSRRSRQSGNGSGSGSGSGGDHRPLRNRRRQKRGRREKEEPSSGSDTDYAEDIELEERHERAIDTMRRSDGTVYRETLRYKYMFDMSFWLLVCVKVMVFIDIFAPADNLIGRAGWMITAWLLVCFSVLNVAFLIAVVVRSRKLGSGGGRVPSLDIWESTHVKTVRGYVVPFSLVSLYFLLGVYAYKVSYGSEEPLDIGGAGYSPIAKFGQWHTTMAMFLSTGTWVISQYVDMRESFSTLAPYRGTRNKKHH